MKHLILYTLIALTWDASTSPCVTGYNVYAKASTGTAFKNITSAAKASVDVKVDGRRNWFFYVTAKCPGTESLPSNTIYVPRGY